VHANRTAEWSMCDMMQKLLFVCPECKEEYVDGFYSDNFTSERHVLQANLYHYDGCLIGQGGSQ
jgi:hypothetical protein